LADQQRLTFHRQAFCDLELGVERTDGAIDLHAAEIRRLR